MTKPKEDRRARERRERRKLLLEAAESVFGRKPYFEATMQEIAAEAQIGMQGLYEHFPSKQDLYESVIIYRMEEMKRIFEEFSKPLEDPIGLLREWSRIHAERFISAPAFVPVFLREKVHHDWGIESKLGPVIKRNFKREEKRLATIIKTGIEKGLLKPSPVSYIRDLFVSCLGASLRYHLTVNSDEEVEQCVRRAMESFISGAGA